MPLPESAESALIQKGPVQCNEPEIFKLQAFSSFVVSRFESSQDKVGNEAILLQKVELRLKLEPKNQAKLEPKLE